MDPRVVVDEKVWSQLAVCLPLGLGIGIFLIARLTAASFSAASARHIQKHPGLHAALTSLALLLILTGFFAPFMPPAWVERRAQRKFVFSNVESQGGWPEFKRECDFLIGYSHHAGKSQWFSPMGDTLPTPCRMLTALKPRQVEVDVWADRPTCVIIQVFGLHSTGGRDTPYYGLVYQQTTNMHRCVAEGLFNRVRPRKLVDSIFEVY